MKCFRVFCSSYDNEEGEEREFVVVERSEGDMMEKFKV